MCGRYSLFAPLNDVEERFGATFVDGYQPRYNAAPSQALPVIPDTAAETIQNAEWGLVPTWADERSDRGHINARAETVGDKPSFEASVRQTGSDVIEDTDAGEWGPRDAGRCLVPADGFYEWGDTGDGRQPHRIEVEDGALFAMAGLWTRWTPPHRQAGLAEFDGEAGGPTAIYTFTILTTDANETLAPIHDRMPVMLERDDDRQWLEADVETAKAYLAPFEGPMCAYTVSEEVNDPANDSPAVTEPLEG